jgi:PhnB protein
MVRGAVDAIEFYQKAFGAEEKMRLPMPDGRIGHAEVRIEGAPVYLADEGPGAGMHSPAQLGGTTVTISIYVADVDAFAKKAQAGGAVVLRPLADQFYGERSVSFRDPFGHTWHFATVTEQLTIEQMKKRMPK